MPDSPLRPRSRVRSDPLSTDSNTGALALYERVGMHVRESDTHLAIDL
jgi:hypothetical protein